MPFPQLILRLTLNSKAPPSLGKLIKGHFHVGSCSAHLPPPHQSLPLSFLSYLCLQSAIPSSRESLPHCHPSSPTACRFVGRRACCCTGDAPAERVRKKGWQRGVLSVLLGTDSVSLMVLWHRGRQAQCHQSN